MAIKRHPQARVITADLLVGLVACGLGLGALLVVRTEVAPTAFQSFGNVRSPAFFPILSSGLLVLLSAALLLRSLLRPVAPSESAPRQLGRVFIVAGVLIGAGVLVNWLGFFLTAALLIVALSYAFGARRHFVVAILALAVPGVIHLLFRTILNVLLPTGGIFS